jgi:hypothetical protein
MKTVTGIKVAHHTACKAQIGRMLTGCPEPVNKFAIAVKRIMKTVNLVTFAGIIASKARSAHADRQSGTGQRICAVRYFRGGDLSGANAV